MNQSNSSYKTTDTQTPENENTENNDGPLADLVRNIESMVLEQIAISDMVMEPTAQELDYEEYVCEEAIEKYLSQTLSLQEYHSWTNGAERSLLTDRPLSGCEFLLRQNQKTFPVWVKRKEIFSSIRENQVTMISGRVGDGRTSCVPQLCLQYLRATRDSSSILIVSTCSSAANWLAGRLAKELGVDDDSLEREGRLELSTDVDEIISLDGNTPRICVLGANEALRLFAARPLLDNFAIAILDDIDKRRVAQDFFVSDHQNSYAPEFTFTVHSNNKFRKICESRSRGFMPGT